MLTLFQGVRARRLAEELCRELYPQEPFFGSVVCADEPTRFVVRVFCGHRPPSRFLVPPWRLCIIIAVDKYTLATEQVMDDSPYQPRLR